MAVKPGLLFRAQALAADMRAHMQTCDPRTGTRSLKHAAMDSCAVQHSLRTCMPAPAHSLRPGGACSCPMPKTCEQLAYLPTSKL
eukprot:1159664-Pelagomonas_calceolata.AAC.7